MSTSIEYTSKQGPVLEKTFEDANDQHVTRVIGYVKSNFSNGVYADSECTKAIDAAELYRLCALGVLHIMSSTGTIYIPLEYSETGCAILIDSEGQLSLQAITFAAE